MFETPRPPWYVRESMTQEAAGLYREGHLVNRITDTGAPVGFLLPAVYHRNMTVVRVPLIVLLSLMLDLLAPVAIGSVEAMDMFEERAIHRPRCNSAIRLVRAVSPSRI